MPKNNKTKWGYINPFYIRGVSHIHKMSGDMQHVMDRSTEDGNQQVDSIYTIYNWQSEHNKSFLYYIVQYIIPLHVSALF
jgi:hypothetical protein